MLISSSVTTPYTLPYFAPRYSLRILLTPTERRKPWLLYLTPGLLPAQLLTVTYSVLSLRTLRDFLLPGYYLGAEFRGDFTPLRFGLYFIVVIVSTAILCPLEVIATKLAIQRNHASAEFNSVLQEEEGDTEETAEYAGAEEDVIGCTIILSWSRYFIDVALVQATPREGSIHWFRRLCQEDSTGRRTRGLVQSVVGNDVGLYFDRLLGLILEYCWITPLQMKSYTHFSPALSSPRENPTSNLSETHSKNTLVTLSSSPSII